MIKLIVSFLFPSKPFKEVATLKSAFKPSYFILITTSYIYINMPELGLDLTMPPLDLSSLFNKITYHTGVVIPTLDIPNMKIVDYYRFIESLPERVLDRPQFMPHNWPHHPDYIRWILGLFTGNHPLFKLSLAGIIWLAGQRLHRLFSSLPSIISNLRFRSKSSLSDYFKLKIVKFKDTFSKGISSLKNTFNKGFLEFNSHIDLLHRLGLNSLFNQSSALKVYSLHSLSSSILNSASWGNTNRTQFLLRYEETARSVRSAIIAIYEVINTTPGLWSGQLRPHQLRRDDSVSFERWSEVLNILGNNVGLAERGLRHLNAQLYTLNRNDPDFLALHEEVDRLQSWLNTAVYGPIEQQAEHNYALYGSKPLDDWAWESDDE